MKASVNYKDFIQVIKSLQAYTGITGKMKYIRMKISCDTQEIQFEALNGHQIGIEYLSCSTDASFTVYIEPFKDFKPNCYNAIIELLGEDPNKIALVIMGEHTIKYTQGIEDWYKVDDLVNNVLIDNPKEMVCINHKYLREVAKSLNTPHLTNKVYIEIRKPKEPIVFRAKENDRNIRLILPINIVS